MFSKNTQFALLSGLALAAASVETPSQAEIDAARATVQPFSPVSNVKGLAFDRFAQIWIENTVCMAATIN